MFKRIMVIDDDECILQAIKSILEDEPLKVDVFADPLDALKEVKRTDYDLFLIDLNLPNIDGISFLQTIKKSEKNSRYIIMTGFGDTHNVIDAFKAGVSDFILKPFSIEKIKNVISTQLAEKDTIDKNIKKWDILLEDTGIADFKNFIRDLDFFSINDLENYESRLKELSSRYNLIAKKNIKKLELMSKQVKKEKKTTSEMLSYISHEIRSPLHSIIGYTRILLKECGHGNIEYMSDFLSDILTLSLYMMDLTHNIISSDTLESDSFKLELEPVSIKDVLKSIKKSLNSRIRSKKLTYIENIASDLDYLVTDRLKLTQILYNLIDNAVKYTDSGEITVEASMTANGKSVRFSVKDTGIGIKYKDKSKLFNKYERLDTSKGRGAGLGLSIVKKLVKLCKGKIWLESRFNHGSTFFFTIPLDLNKNLTGEQ